MSIDSVPLRKLKTHPDNPRLGYVDAIAESLLTHGQYKPIVVNRKTNHIVAGNHTFKAAKQLGYRSIDVVWIDVDEQTERRMLVADNRMADLALTNEAMVSDLLGTLPDLTGTGYSDEFIKDVTEREKETSGDGGTPDEKESSEEEPPQLRIGPFRADIEATQYLWWSSELADLKRNEVVSILRMRLEFPNLDKEKESVPRETEYTGPSVSDAGLVDVNALQPHPTNPREGDVGAIMQSLMEFGQYRPIVINQHGTILAGHHVWYAAINLGWEDIWAVRIDVDEEQALKILLVDNRTSDLGDYDNGRLASTLSSLTDLRGTGYDHSDIEAILNGAMSTPKANGKTSCVVGKFRWREPNSVVDEWAQGKTLNDVADLLGLPRESLT